MIQYCNYDIKGTLAVTGTSTFTGAVTTGGDLTIGGTGGIFIPEYIYHAGDGNTCFGFPSNDIFRVITGGTARFEITTSTVNVSNASFKALGSLATGSGMAETGVGLGQMSNYAHAQFSGSAGGYIDFAEPNVDYSGRIIYTHSSDSMVFYTATSVVLTLDSSNNATFANNITVSGGNITLSGTGRIQGVDTVSANTDAANKLYVDNAVSGISSGVTSIATTNGITGGTIDATTPTGTLQLDSTVIRTTGNQTKAGNFTIEGSGSSGNALSITRGSDGANAFRIQNSGEVVTGANYLYAAASGTSMYVQNTAVFRGGIVNDGSNAPVLINDDLKVNVDLEVAGGDITLGGTGRIQGVDTVSASTDAANKAYVDSQIATIPSGLNFQGNWNASTNSPTLTSGSGTPGFYYNVSVAGSTNLDGETDWQVGDWAVFVEAGATDKWEKIDNTSALTGVGVSGRVTFWNGTNTLSSNSNFTYDGNNLAVGGSMTWSGGSSTESNLAYDRSITSFSDSGTSTVTLTIGRQDGNSLSTSFNVPQGTVTGTGSNNRLALWNGTTAIDSNENLSISGNDLAIGTQAGTTTARLLLYGTTANNGASVIKTTNGNLHIDSDDGHSTYVNYYTGTDTGSSLVIGNGASGTSGTFFQATGAATIGGDLTISGGDITLSGTGRIQGVDTVSASTDAANKAYVDAHTSGVQTINEGDGIKKSGTASSVTISANYDSGDSDNLIHAATAVNSINGASSGYAAYVLAAESNPGLAAGPVNKIRVSDIHLDDFGAAEANINLNSNKITNLSTPTASTDAATKAYVDAVPTGNVSGSGLSTRIAFWSGGSSLTSDQDLTFAVGTNRLSSGNYIIPNNGDYLGTDTSGAARTLITLDNSNNVEISNAALSSSSDTNIYFGDNFRIKDGGSTRFSVQSNGTISGNGNTFNSGPINLEEDNKIIFDDDGDQWNYIQATSGDMEMGVGGNGLTLRNIEENIYGEITVNTLRNVVDNFITNSTATYIPVYTSASSSTPQVQRQQTPAKFIENNGIVKGAPGTSGRVAVWTGSGFTNSIGSDTLYWNSTNNVLGVNYSGSTFNSGAVQIQGPTSNSGGIGLQIYNSTSGAPYGAHGIFVNGPRYGNAGISVKNPNVGSTFMRFYSSSGSSVGTISQSGSSSTSYNTSSDYRLKENIEPMSGSIERIKALKPCRFNFIEEEIKDKKGVKRKVDGFLAHEASGVVPEAVTGQKDELDYKGDPEYQSIDQSKLVPLLTSALQEALAKIESLETRLDTLEQKK